MTINRPSKMVSFAYFDAPVVPDTILESAKACLIGYLTMGIVKQVNQL